MILRQAAFGVVFMLWTCYQLSKLNDSMEVVDVERKAAARIAIMIVGDVRIYGIPIWESVRTHVLEPIQEHYYDSDPSKVEVFVCTRANPNSAALRERIAEERQQGLIDPGLAIEFWTFEGGGSGGKSLAASVAAQFARVAICYDKIEHHLNLNGTDPYDYIVKVRPDTWWFHSVPLPFSKQHVMGRARKAQGLHLTRGQLSYTLCEPCHGNRLNPNVHANPCLMVDDQVAVVPRRLQEAYFRGPAGKFNDPVSGDSATKHGNESWPVVRLAPPCPCNAPAEWPEAIFTSHLARLNLTFMVAPFHLRLTNNGGAGFRYDPACPRSPPKVCNTVSFLDFYETLNCM